MVEFTRLRSWNTEEGIHQGQGKAQYAFLFQGKMDANVGILECVLMPGAFVGYHRHEGNEEIYYVLSGEGEYLHDGERSTMGPGDASLVKSGKCHGIRNTGEQDLRLLVFGAALQNCEGSTVNLPDSKEVADWK